MNSDVIGNPPPLCAFDCELLLAVVHTHMFFCFIISRALRQVGLIACGRASETVSPNLAGVATEAAELKSSESATHTRTRWRHHDDRVSATTPATLSCHPSPLTSWQHARIKIDRACLACRLLQACSCCVPNAVQVCPQLPRLPRLPAESVTDSRCWRVSA